VRLLNRCHGLAAPVFGRDGEILGSVIAALSTARVAITDLAVLARNVTAAAATVARQQRAA
jgi:DNA-binding IclR family transcriptional regulator